MPLGSRLQLLQRGVPPGLTQFLLRTYPIAAIVSAATFIIDASGTRSARGQATYKQTSKHIVRLSGTEGLQLPIVEPREKQLNEIFAAAALGQCCGE